MSGQPNNIMLIYMRRLMESMDDLKYEVREIKIPVTLVEESMATLAKLYAGMQGRIDKIEVHLDRIEHRLDLREPAA